MSNSLKDRPVLKTRLLTAGFLALALILPYSAKASTSIDNSALPDTSTLTADALNITFAQMYEGGEQSIIHWNNLWQFEIKPAFQDMTKQLHTAIIDQVRTHGSFIDAMAQADFQRATQRQELQDRLDHAPSESTCAVASHTPSLATAGHLSRSVTRGLGNQSTKTGLNAAGTPSVTGTSGDLLHRYQMFQQHFCDVNTNKGAANCVSGHPSLIDADISVENFLLRDTIDLSNEIERKGVYAITRNLLQPTVSSPIAEVALQGAEGRQNLIKQRSILALKDITTSVVGGIVGRRTAVPGSFTSNGAVREIREKAGVDPNHISDRPSYNEIILALSKERFLHPEYFVRLNQSESAIRQEQAAVDILTGIVLQNVYQLQEQMNTLMAARASLKFNAYTFDDMIGSAPTSD